MAKVLCPAYLDKGHSRNNFRQSGVSWIKEGTELTYEIEVHSCVEQLTFPKDDPIIPKRCVYITIDGQGKTMALTSSDEDKYAPRSTGLYDVVITPFKGIGNTDKA